MFLPRHSIVSSFNHPRLQALPKYLSPEFAIKMKGPLSQVVLIAGAIIPSALCALSSYTQEQCSTSLGSKQVNPVPSKTTALTLTFHPLVVSTSTPVKTVTPKPATLVTTVFVTTTTVDPVVSGQATSLRFLSRVDRVADHDDR